MINRALQQYTVLCHPVKEDARIIHDFSEVKDKLISLRNIWIEIFDPRLKCLLVLLKKNSL